MDPDSAGAALAVVMTALETGPFQDVPLARDELQRTKLLAGLACAVATGQEELLRV
jgi:hypothetical protein